METSEAMLGALQTGLCELGMVELVDYVHEFLPETAANLIAIKQLNKMWRFIAMMAAHWEGAVFCKNKCHMLLNPTKLQKPNAEKDAWCCDYNCGYYCTCNIPKCLKDDDELQEERIGGYPAFQFLAIDCATSKGVPGADVLPIREHQPVLDNVYFDSWPQDDVVAIRFLAYNDESRDQGINNKMLERFGPRNLRMFLAGRAPVSPVVLEKCSKLKWLDLVHTQETTDGATMSAVAKLPQLKRLSLESCRGIPEDSFKLLRDSKCLEHAALPAVANGAITEEVSRLKSLVSLDLAPDDVSDDLLASLVANGPRLERLKTTFCGIAETGFLITANITSLRELRSSWSVISDSVVEAIGAKLLQLEFLELSCKRLTDTGIAALGNLKSLQRLSLEDVQRHITPEVFNAALEKPADLRVLSVQFPDATSKHYEFLERHVNLEVFSLGLSFDVDDEVLRFLRNHTKLKRVILEGCEGITSNGVAHLSQLTEIESLSLANTKVDDVALQRISGMTKMRWLTLWCCKGITDEGLRLLGGMKQIEFLNVGMCEKVTATGVIRCVDKLPKCKVVGMRRYSDEAGVQQISARFPHILIDL